MNAKLLWIDTKPLALCCPFFDGAARLHRFPARGPCDLSGDQALLRTDKTQCRQCFSGPVSKITAAGEAGRQVNH